MSNKKRLAIIAATAFALLIIGLIKVTITTSHFAVEIPNFTLAYMLGYSIPILSMGAIVFFLSNYILREKTA